MNFDKFKSDMDILGNIIINETCRFKNKRTPCWVIISKQDFFAHPRIDRIRGQVSKVNHKYKVHADTKAEAQSQTIKEIVAFAKTPLRKRKIDLKTFKSLNKKYPHGKQFVMLFKHEFKNYYRLLPNLNRKGLLENDHNLYDTTATLLYLKIGELLRDDRSTWRSDPAVQNLLSIIRGKFMSTLKNNIFSNTQSRDARISCINLLRELNNKKLHRLV